MFRSRAHVAVAKTERGTSRFVVAGSPVSTSKKQATGEEGEVAHSVVASRKVTTALGDMDVMTPKQLKEAKKQNIETGSSTETGTVVAAISTDALFTDVLFEFVANNNNNNQGERRINTTINRIYRDMYNSDSICGSAVDLFSNLPFSEFTLTGLRDDKALAVYTESCERCNVVRFMPHASRDHLVVGAVLACLSWDANKKIYNGISPQNLDQAFFTPVPVYGADPLINLQIDENTKAYLKYIESDPRAEAYKKMIPSDIMESVKRNDKNDGIANGIPLHPDNTLFIPRLGLMSNFMGHSFFRRALPVWLIEKAFIRGTMDQGYKRQRAITHIAVGDIERPATMAEMEAILGDFLNADADPVGAAIATRANVVFNEIRRGDDFFKWCLTGDTLIPTKEYGLIRIDKLVEEKDKVFTTLGGEGPAKTRDTWYSGIKPVYEINTNMGNRIRATSKHGFLTLQDDMSLKWKPLGKLNVDDTLCLSTKEMYRHEDLELADFEYKSYGNERPAIIPNKMSPDLAYFIGLMVSEGSFNKYVFQFGNTDKKICKKYKELVWNLFGIDVLFKQQKNSGYGEFSSSKFMASHSCSTKVCAFLKYLGLTNTSNDGNSIASNKQIPWSILEADAESQRAFLAAYIDGDGRVTNNGIGVYSKSSNLLYQMQSLFATHSIMSHVACRRNDKYVLYLNKEAAYRAYALLDKYFVDKVKMPKPKWPHGIGVPTENIKRILRSRRIASGIYANDEGTTVTANVNLGRDFRSKWLVTEYKKGMYESQLNSIKLVSKKLYNNILDIFNREYDFVNVKSIEYLGEQPTYDISMDKKYEPSFTANGIIVHNTDVYDQLSTIKMRALGLSESFISGESTYSNMEQVLSLTMDQIRAHRAQMSHEIFYMKMFPRIAKEHNFTAKKYRNVEIASLMPQFNSAGARGYVDFDGMTHAEIADTKRPSLADFNPNDYAMPQVVWIKRLMPEADRDYLDMLTTLEEKGIPVSIRTIAAAGGQNLKQLIDGAQEDLKVREQLAKIRERIKEFAPQAPDEGADEMASILMGMGRTPQRHILNREYGEIDMPDLDSRGRRRVQREKYRKQRSEKVNKVMAEVAADLAKKENALIAAAQSLREPKTKFYFRRAQ